MSSVCLGANLQINFDPCQRKTLILDKLGGVSEKLKTSFGFSLNLHYVEGCALEIRRRLGKTQNKFWFFAQLALILPEIYQ